MNGDELKFVLFKCLRNYLIKMEFSMVVDWWHQSRIEKLDYVKRAKRRKPLEPWPLRKCHHTIEKFTVEMKKPQGALVLKLRNAIRNR